MEHELSLLPLDDELLEEELELPDPPRGSLELEPLGIIG